MKLDDLIPTELTLDEALDNAINKYRWMLPQDLRHMSNQDIINELDKIRDKQSCLSRSRRQCIVEFLNVCYSDIIYEIRRNYNS